MSWTSPRTWTDTTLILADDLNEQLRDNLTYLKAGVDAPVLKIAILQDVKASGTHAGGSTATTWTTRDLNTEVSDPSSIVTLSSNRFTPVAGNYVALFEVQTDREAGYADLRIYNFTQSTVAAWATLNSNTFTNSSTGQTNLRTLSVAYMTANGTDAFQAQVYLQNAIGSTGLGVRLNVGSRSERYTQITLIKVG